MHAALQDRCKAITLGFVDANAAKDTTGWQVYCCTAKARAEDMAPLQDFVDQKDMVLTVLSSRGPTSNVRFLDPDPTTVFQTVCEPALEALVKDGTSACISFCGVPADSLVCSMDAGRDGVLLSSAKRLLQECSRNSKSLLLSIAVADNDDVQDMIQDGTEVPGFNQRWAAINSAEDFVTCMQPSQNAAAAPLGGSPQHRVIRMALQPSGNTTHPPSMFTVVELLHASHEGPTAMEAGACRPQDYTLRCFGNVMQAIAYQCPFVPYHQCALTRLLRACVGMHTTNSLVVDLSNAPQPMPAAAEGLLLVSKATVACNAADREALARSIVQRKQLLDADEGQTSSQMAQRLWNFERGALADLQRVELSGIIDHRHSQKAGAEGYNLEYSTSLETLMATNGNGAPQCEICGIQRHRLEALEAQAALEYDHRLLALKSCEELELRNKAERVLWKAQSERQRKQIELMQDNQAKLERELDEMQDRLSCSGEETQRLRERFQETKEQLRSMQGDWCDGRMSEIKEFLLSQSVCHEVSKEEVEKQLEVLENLYQIRHHQSEAESPVKAEKAFGTVPPRTESCHELQKVIQNLHQELLEKGLQLYRQVEDTEALRREYHLQSEQLLVLQADHEAARTCSTAGRWIHRQALALAEALFNVESVGLLSGRRALTGNDPLLPPILRGLEALLSDRLYRGSTFWDFVQHTQRTMSARMKKQFVNPEAKEQVTAVSKFQPPTAYKGQGHRWCAQLWLLFNLNSRSLLDALGSLASLRPAYYGPGAFLCTPEGWAFVLAVLRQMHFVTFKLSLTDIKLFDPNMCQATADLPTDPAPRPDRSPSLSPSVASSAPPKLSPSIPPIAALTLPPRLSPTMSPGSAPSVPTRSPPAISPRSVASSSSRHSSVSNLVLSQPRLRLG